jgi:predicted kinase
MATAVELFLNGGGMKAILTIGLPGCGKSTWATKMAKDDDCVIIERDIIRQKICHENGRDFSWETWDTRLEARVTKMWESAVEKATSEAKDIIFADTNLNPVYRTRLVKRLSDLGYIVEYVFFDVDEKTCMQRNALRGSKAVEENAYRVLGPRFFDAKNDIAYECARLGVVSLTKLNPTSY